MKMTYKRLLKAELNEIECIRKQPFTDKGTPLIEAKLIALKDHLNTFYENEVQLSFAFSIYMKAGNFK